MTTTLILAMFFNSQAMNGRSLFFKKSPEFAYAMAGNWAAKLTLAEQQEKYERDMMQRYIDSYLDAVRIIIKDVVANLGVPFRHARLMNVGREAIIEALATYNDKTGTLDNHVHETIRKRITEDLKRSA